jgi:hypothetical protein
MKQTTETEDGTRVTVDTNNAPPYLTIEREGATIRLTPNDQDAIFAIRSGMSRLLDSAAKAPRTGL